MLSHCYSVFNHHKYSFLLMSIFVPFLIKQLPSILVTFLLSHLDYFISYGSFTLITEPALITEPTVITQSTAITQSSTELTQPSSCIDDTIKKDNNNNNITKKPNLLIDTKPTLNQESNKPITRRRHCSVSYHNNATEINFFANTPTLSPSASSVSSFSSNWSEEQRRLTKVEEMIHLFETGGHKPQRRYSVDSHNYNNHSKQFIRERKFEFKPIAGEWKKRVHSAQNSPIQLTMSASTPVRRKMPPIPEKSKSTWA